MVKIIEEQNDQRVRPDLKCLSIGGVYDKLQYLSKQEGLSASGYIRQMILRQWKREGNKEPVQVS